jgi:hypothetical protein
MLWAGQPSESADLATVGARPASLMDRLPPTPALYRCRLGAVGELAEDFRDFQACTATGAMESTMISIIAFSMCCFTNGICPKK